MAAPTVALVNRASVDLELDRLARALQTQVDRDFAPVWGTPARVTAVSGRRPPSGSWPIYIVREPQAGLGVHLDHHEHPFAEVRVGDSWTLAVSHALLELLCDPGGRRFMRGPSVVPGAGDHEVRYLVETCGPCQVLTYTIHGMRVSDFVTPDYYRPDGVAAFDFLRTLERPLQVPRGCCLSWQDPGDGHWHERRPDGRFERSPHPIDPDARSPRDDRDRAFGDDGRHDHSALTRPRA
ncbi:MAG TPA: hypothetical protein VGO86_14515 [Candidatus Dormibacteraeota bacterium]